MAKAFDGWRNGVRQLILLGVAFAFVRPAYGDGTLALPPVFTDSDAARFQEELGADVVIREIARLTTERGERAAIVLHVRNPEKYEFDEPGPMSCPEYVSGKFGLTGDYVATLFVGASRINDVVIGSRLLPTATYHSANRAFWGEPASIGADRRDNEVERVTLMRLADYNGDGRSWEFRTIDFAACGHLTTSLVGYSARRRQLIQYPLIAGERRTFGDDNLFPNPAAVGKGGRFRSAFVCGDHGNDVQNVVEFAYDEGQEAWVLARGESRQCSVAADDNRDADVWLHINRSDLIAGGSGMLELMLRSRKDVSVTLDFDLVFDFPVQIGRADSGSPDCTATGANIELVSVPSVVDPCAQVAKERACQPKDAVSLSLRAALTAGQEVQALTCRVTVPQEALSGFYPIWTQAPRAQDAAGAPLIVRSFEGMIALESNSPQK